MTECVAVAVPQADGDPTDQASSRARVFRPEWTVEQVTEAIRQTDGHLIGDCFPLQHRFAPGVYAREITMPAGFVVVGKKHLTEHFNIISKGRVSFWMDGHPVKEVTAPYTFVSGPGVQKVLYIHEDTVWTTIHPTQETDLAALEAALIEPVEPAALPPGAVGESL